MTIIVPESFRVRLDCYGGDIFRIDLHLYAPQFFLIHKISWAQWIRPDSCAMSFVTHFSSSTCWSHSPLPVQCTQYTLNRSSPSQATNRIQRSDFNRLCRSCTNWFVVCNFVASWESKTLVIPQPMRHRAIGTRAKNHHHVLPVVPPLEQQAVDRKFAEQS